MERGSAGKKASFMEQIGRPVGEIDFTQRIHGVDFTLEMPINNDSIEVIVEKMEGMAQLVMTGKSVAVNTGYKGAASQDRDPVSICKESMTPLELQQYESWESGSEMPAYDWSVSSKPIVGGAGAKSRFARQALAAQEIWNRNDITTENINWLAANQTFILPLIKALTRVQGAKRNLRGGAVAIASDLQNTFNARHNRFNRHINDAKDELQARGDAIKARLLGY
ncbi:hypothetical protein GcM3_147012 [Golovinomyces cichoracearum]|uniref:Uncharacterized protein n=1 Tax=Golovinomyces cichoracearum TaxID=62708 RepID=A0A420HYD6_9PEZI|nr:hypothetical protein GcM3_147012 [Golovinomyces cichoracearum]